MNYFITFKDTKTAKTEKYCVWSQPWTNSWKITHPDGSTISNTAAQNSENTSKTNLSFIDKP